MTFVNQSSGPSEERSDDGERQAPRTRLVTFVNGNRVWLRAFVLIEQRELILSFERIRIADSIQFELSKCLKTNSQIMLS